MIHVKKKLFWKLSSFVSRLSLKLKVHYTSSWSSTKRLQESENFKRSKGNLKEQQHDQLIIQYVHALQQASCILHKKTSSSWIVQTIVKQDSKSLADSEITSFRTPHNNFKTLTLPSKLQKETWQERLLFSDVSSCFSSSLQRETDTCTYQQLLASNKKFLKCLSTDWLVFNTQSCWTYTQENKNSA